MSVSTIQNNPLAGALRGTGRPLTNGAGVQPGAGQAGGIARPAGAAAPTALKPTQPLASPQQSLPSEAPAGTDPALWSVLSSEERSYFAKAAAMGPLTYSRISAGVSSLQGGGAPPAAAQLGARLDIRA